MEEQNSSPSSESDAENPTPETCFDKALPWLMYALSAVAFIAALVRMFGSDRELTKRIDQVTLEYIVVSAAFLLIRNVKSLVIGGTRIDFVEGLAKKAIGIAKNAEATAVNNLPSQKLPGPKETKSTRILPGDFEDDPWKGRFGGKCAANNRLLSAKVVPLSDQSGWYVIDAQVRSTLPGKDPLSGTVQFYLHDSFPDDRPVVPVGADGTARLIMRAWGAFTIGVVADQGATKLELDLAEMKDVPLEFANH